MLKGTYGHTEYSTVSTYDIDANKRMTLPALVRHMQEAAMQNVFRLKLSVWDMEDDRIAWVLMRKDLHIHRMPMLGESLVTHTYPSGFDRLFTFRDYRVTTDKEEPIADSSTTWLLMNTENRRPSRIPKWLLDRFPEMPPPEECLPRAKAEMPEWLAADHSRSHQVGWHDLDFNMHLNNTEYLRLLLDTLPKDCLLERVPSLIRIHYLLEAGLDQTLEAARQDLAPHQYLHRLFRPEDDKVLAWAESHWAEIS